MDAPDKSDNKFVAANCDFFVDKSISHEKMDDLTSEANRSYFASFLEQLHDRYLEDFNKASLSGDAVKVKEIMGKIASDLEAERRRVNMMRLEDVSKGEDDLK
jgi:hypothetical protein